MTSATQLPSPLLSATVELAPALYDVDAMGVVWHGNYFRFLEHAREALLDRIDFGYLKMDASGFIWPIVETRMKFIAPVAFGQRVRVTATLVEFENRLRIDYEVADAATGECRNRARTTQIAVRKDTHETCFVSPPELVEKVRAALAKIAPETAAGTA